jgi:hypothetical protein
VHPRDQSSLEKFTKLLYTRKNMELTKLKPNNIIVVSSKHLVNWRVSLDMSQSRKESFWMRSTI